MDTNEQRFSWYSVPIAGIVAGTVFLLMNMFLNPILYGIDQDFILRYFASLVLGTDILIDASTTDLIVGAIVHYILSILFTIVIAIVVHRWGLLVGILGGALLGLAIFAINFYTMTLFFEWMFAIQSPLMVVSHIVFGAVAGGVYEIFDTYDEPLVKEVEA